MVLLGLLGTNIAHGQAAVAVDAVDGQFDMAPRLAVLEDHSRVMQFAAARVAPFVPNTASVVSFGFADHPVWLRFRTSNASAESVRWYLELDEPSLDHVELFVERDGRPLETFVAGDALPFVTRSLPFPRTVFELSSPPGDRATYYLRIQSDDVMRLPLHLYSARAFAVHQQVLTAATWASYGLLLMLALYNIVVHFVIKRAHHGRIGLACIAFVFVLMSLQGVQSQVLAPTSPALAARMAPMSMALACFAVLAFLSKVVENIEHLGNQLRLFKAMWFASGVLVVFTALAPVGLALRVLAGVFLLVSPFGTVVIFHFGRRPYPELRMYRLSWYVLALCLPIPVLLYANALPPWQPFEWAVAAGFIGYGTMVSIALPVWASGIESKLATANAMLTSNVGELQHALTRAERATRAKDDFLATMSHELRTPLNAIINLPQGLVSEFVSVRAASCSVCRTNFVLDEADVIGPATVCANCQSEGSLVEGTKTKYKGDNARLLRFLKKIERSGAHLLQMVNGILDYSKIEAGHFQLNRERVHLGPLLDDVVEQMNETAQQRQIRIAVEAAGSSEAFYGDGLRLTQVLLNLLANALKFSEPGSEVKVRWVSDRDAEIIEVEDHGIGIAAEHLERIFAGFEQVHQGDTRKYGGTGLGLSISRSLVRMHGGELTVRSELGKGSTFVVRIPRSAA